MPVIKYTEEMLREAVKDSITIRQVLDKIGSRTIVGGMSTHIRSRIRHYGIDTSHFVGAGWSKGIKKTNISSHFVPAEKLLVKHTDGTRMMAHRLRRALISIGVPHKCKICNLPPMWLDRPIVLEVDHMDGDGSNDIPENLRFLCPNCHSQTDTFRTKNRQLKQTIQKQSKLRPTKIDWPLKENLELLVKTHPMTIVGLRLGVSDNAVRKRCNKLGITFKTMKDHSSMVRASVL